MTKRVELKEQDLENVVGGAFNFYYDANGAKRCDVDNVGDYACSADARDRLTALKIQHRADRWSAAQYTEALINEGYFW